MSVNGVAAMNNLVPEVFSANIYDELRNSIAFLNVFSREYEGEIRGLGDVVRISQIQAPNGEIISTDTNSFGSETMTVNNFSITVNKRASAAFEFTDLAQLQSLSFQEEAQQALVYAIRLKIENDIISALVPSASAPDHDIAPAAASDLAAADVAAMRTLLSAAKVPVQNRALMLSPTYYGDLLTKTQITSRDFVQGNSAESGVVDNFLGFRIMEHNLLPSDEGYAVHPSAMQLALQQEVRVKISDLHAQNKYGYLMSADIVYGFTLMDDERIVKISG